VRLDRKARRVLELLADPPGDLLMNEEQTVEFLVLEAMDLIVTRAKGNDKHYRLSLLGLVIACEDMPFAMPYELGLS
jgi:hypothetical protein